MLYEVANMFQVEGAYYPRSNVSQKVKTQCPPSDTWAHYGAKVYGCKYSMYIFQI